MSAMTTELRELLALALRRREKLAKARVDQVAAERLADFEQQAASDYRAGDDEVWAEQWRIVEEVVEDAKIRVAERCRELGVPDWTAPTISASWYRRGENAIKERVVELRKVASTRINADAKAAKTAIERASLEVQEQLLVAGLESDEAREFLDAMPTPEALLPPLRLAEIEKAGSRSREYDDLTTW
jgi:hypothetical protein